MPKGVREGPPLRAAAKTHLYGGRRCVALVLVAPICSREPDAQRLGFRNEKREFKDVEASVELGLSSRTLRMRGRVAIVRSWIQNFRTAGSLRSLTPFAELLSFALVFNFRRCSSCRDIIFHPTMCLDLRWSMSAQAF